MRLHTLSTETTHDPRQRGRAVGSRFATRIGRAGELYLAHFDAVGIDRDTVAAITDRSHRALRVWHPALAAESDAMAEAAGVPRWVVAALGARTEVLVAAPPSAEGECSTAVRVAAGLAQPETVQTWDWHDHLAPDGLLHALTAASGRRVRLFTEFGMPAKIGVNDAGLGVHFNFLSHASDTVAGGVPVHAVVRRVLEEAGTIDEAVAIAATAPVSASAALTVCTAGADGARVASIELSPADGAVVGPDRDGWLLHTNHFLDPTLSAGDTMPPESTTAERHAHLVEVRAAMAGLAVAERAKAMCGAAGSAAPVCLAPDPTLPPHERWTTLLTISIATAEPALHYRAGTPDVAADLGFQRF